MATDEPLVQNPGDVRLCPRCWIGYAFAAERQCGACAHSDAIEAETRPPLVQCVECRTVYAAAHWYGYHCPTCAEALRNG